MPSTTNIPAPEVAEVPDLALEPNGKSSASSYELREEPIHSRRPLRVVCLGAGYSGILMGIIWSQRMQNRGAELVLYERNAGLGGTWLENRYV